MGRAEIHISLPGDWKGEFPPAILVCTRSYRQSPTFPAVSVRLTVSYRTRPQFVVNLLMTLGLDSPASQHRLVHPQ